MNFTATDIGRAVHEAFFPPSKKASAPSVLTVIARASSATIKQAGELLKTGGRTSIRAAGFSAKWQNAWRVQVYPKGSTPSIDSAAFAFHKIPYSEIFETGGSISGKRGLLWLPLPTAPKKVGRGKVSPRALRAKGVKLFSMKSKRGTPLLGASVRLGKNANTKKRFSLGALTRGGSGAVPLFFGVRAVTLRKRFNIAGVTGAIRARLGSLYNANLGAS